MSIHLTQDSMKLESLMEIMEVVKYCLDFDKSKSEKWGVPGCYGYPAALLLLSVVDSIGAHIKGGGYDTKIHFEILNDPDWFNLGLSQEQLMIIRKGFRHRLSHQSVMDPDLMLVKGKSGEKIISSYEGITILNLTPFYELTREMIKKLDLKLKIVI